MLLSGARDSAAAALTRRAAAAATAATECNRVLSGASAAASQQPSLHTVAGHSITAAESRYAGGEKIRALVLLRVLKVVFLPQGARGAE